MSAETDILEQPQSALLTVAELTVAKKRGTFFNELTITGPQGEQLGSAREAGNVLLRLVNVLSDSLLFPSRPSVVRDAQARAVLRIQRRGILRRHTSIVRRPDRTLIGKVVGKTWASGFRHTGYWIEVDGQRVGELVFEKPAYRILDNAGVELAEVARLGESRTHVTYVHTRLRAHQPLSESIAALAIAAMIIRNEGG
ncbi:hypothetical protein [Rhodococcus sp. HNM0569]|uniref:hypothetical protein n=1 Tax=Rhodococcus sp. HNM0569 TaxID=2716340 RepID=UPI00146C4D73|nr:hypothetical protein [Rhodococcus sp. HNM0569]NLU82098.1 hypothetical protein [Rhodococcus sp. HNM0569]